MNRICKRARALCLLLALLLGGMGYFLHTYSRMARQWVFHPANSQRVSVTVTDRCGQLLRNGGQYSGDRELDAATVHWLGDRAGNIHSPLLSHYAPQLTGYDPINGLYSYAGTGGDLHLTLSGQVQKVALQAMGSYKGTISVMNYRTGEILCAVTTPAFHPDVPPNMDQDPQKYDGIYWNRYTQGLYIPGSIFKIVTTAAALECVENICQQTFLCTGQLKLDGGLVICEMAHGQLDLKTAMMCSCNCAYAQVALLLGQENLRACIDRYGVLERVCFDGITTAAGSVDGRPMLPADLAWTAIGQHRDQINPCTFLTFLAAIANGGQGVEPYLVASVIRDGKAAYEAEVVLRQPIVQPEVASIVKDFMRNNVAQNYGDSHFPGLTVCAKSGTGEVDGGARAFAMFAGFLTDESYPLAFFVAVEDAGYGKTVCVPIVSQVLLACKAELDETA